MGASRQQAKLLELLTPIHRWGIEGFDTADLEEDRVLLEDPGHKVIVQSLFLRVRNAHDHGGRVI